MTDRSFTHAGYASLLDAFAHLGYAVVDFTTADPAARHLILRHDLDMSIQAALPIAEIEAARGMRADYFVLLRTEMYNPWSAAGRRDLSRLAALGHGIGLHFDASLYPDVDAALDAAAHEECDALAQLLGRPVEMVSFHRPVSRLQGRAAPVGGRRHAYEPRFFAEMGYCSDSRGAWYHGHPLQNPAVAHARALQLLTHPIWWGSSAAAPEARLHEFLTARATVLDRKLALNCSIHVPRNGNGDGNDA
jgi:hypothetical protein